MIIILYKSTFSFCQSDFKVMDIKYFDFSMTTDSKIDCNLFEYAGNFKTIQYTDSTKIKEFLFLTKSLKRDTAESYMPDVRAKIILRTRDGEKDIICLSNLGICFNNTPMKMNDKYLYYIKRLIKAKDKEFDF